MVAVSESPSAVAPQGTLQREPQAKVQDIENPQAELAALQSSQAALRIERERLVRQLESHQAEGQKRLAQLKAQWTERNAGSGPDDAAARERFAESARVEMESALMMDQEYRTHLEETESSLRETQRRMDELRKQAAGEPEQG